MPLFRPLFRAADLAWLGIVLVGSLLLLAALPRWHRPDRAPAMPSAEAVAASRQSAREAARSARWAEVAAAWDMVLASLVDDLCDRGELRNNNVTLPVAGSPAG